MSQYVIRKVRLAHCKRGPDRCEECRTLAAEKRICLLDVCPPREGEIQRRVIKLLRGGVETWREFDIVRVFESPEDARLFADEYGIEDVEL
jgi:hypothetical protein